MYSLLEKMRFSLRSHAKSKVVEVKVCYDYLYWNNIQSIIVQDRLIS